MKNINIHQEKDKICRDLIEEANQLLEIDYETIRSERFLNKVHCPHCLCKTGKPVSNYVRYGLVYGTKWQRYRCNQCEHIFSDLTGTLFHRSRNIRKWPLFIKLLMVDQLSMKEISRIVEVHINTVYTWNKKLQVFIDEFLPKRQHPSI